MFWHSCNSGGGEDLSLTSQERGRDKDRLREGEKKGERVGKETERKKVCVWEEGRERERLPGRQRKVGRKRARQKKGRREAERGRWWGSERDRQEQERDKDQERGREKEKDSNKERQRKRDQ